MPHVLFNMPSQFGGRPSGVARSAFQLLDSLMEFGNFDYSLRSPWTREQLPDPLRKKSLKVLTIARPPLLILDVLKQALVFPAYCRREGIDLVVNVDPFGSPTGGRARLTIVHDLYFRTIPKQIGKRGVLTNDLIFRLMLLGNDPIVTVSNATKRDLEFWYPQSKDRISTVHWASSLRPNAGLNAAPAVNGRYVMAVGNATENKNFEVLAEAVAKIHPLMPDVAIVHVGADRRESIAGTLQRLGSPVRLVRFADISDEHLASLYRGAGCLCVPSYYEGFCLPVLEAQICGCPVVCADRSATPEVAGEGALLFDPSDSAALGECLKRVLSDTDVAGALAQKGFENVAQFSWETAAREYEAIFRTLLDRHQP
jgi:glycosyltransferase involved in cell wall biosynthesis